MAEQNSRTTGMSPRPDSPAGTSKTLLERAVEKVCAALMGGIVILLSTQIFVRYLLVGSVPWTGEMAAWLFSWSTFMGAILVYIEKKHIVIDFLISFLPPKILSILNYIQNIITLSLLIFLMITGIQITRLYATQTATSIEISKAFLFVSLPISCLTMLLYTLYSFVKGR